MSAEEDQQPISAEQFDQMIRETIDQAIQSGVSADDVERTLRKHAEGTSYYYEDFQRYVTRPQLAQQQAEQQAQRVDADEPEEEADADDA